MLKNKDLLSKKKFIKAAAMVSLPTISLTPEESNQFIDYVVDESSWKDNARIVKMSNAEKNIRYLDFTSGTRFLKPASTFASSDYVKTLTHDLITLHTEKMRGAIVIYDDDLEDGIEGQAFADHLMKLVSKKIANELDEAYYVANSSFASTDARSLWDGWRYSIINDSVLSNTYTLLDASNTISGHTSDFTNAGKIAEKNSTSGIWEFKFAKMLAKLPSKYKAQGLGNLRFFCNDVIASDYIEALSDRSTILGDNAVLGNAKLTFGTVPIAQVPLMPTTYAAMDGTDDGLEAYGSGDYADAVLTHKSNFIIGLQRDIKMESKRAPEDEATYMFVSVRADVKIENPEACVFLANVTHT